MNKIIKSLIIFFLLVNCSTDKVKKQRIEPMPEIPIELEILNKFFSTCRSDVEKAIKIVSGNQMVGNLTHLKKMNDGGKKYYLLERENLTEMIKQVTEGTYSDLILINNKGAIIYTMVNDEIFGKSVIHHYKNTSILRSFEQSSKGIFHIEDISAFPSENENKTLLVSFPDISANTFRGVLVMQINIDIIEKLFPNKTFIIGEDGIYKISSDRENILTPYANFDKINPGIKEKSQFQLNGHNYIYYPYKNDNLNWIIISEK